MLWSLFSRPYTFTIEISHHKPLSFGDGHNCHDRHNMHNIHNCAYCDSCVRRKARNFLSRETLFSMAEDQNPKFTRWNLRPFPEDIKRECNVRAAKEGKKDWRWLADYLRKVLPIVETSDINSAQPPQETARIKAKKTKPRRKSTH